MKLSFWQWFGIVIIVSIVGGIIIRYRAIKVVGDIEKTKAENGDNIKYYQSGY